MNKKVYEIVKELWTINYLPYRNVDFYKMATDRFDGCDDCETVCTFSTKEEALNELHKMRSDIDVQKNYGQTIFTIYTIACVEYADDEICNISGDGKDIAPFDEDVLAKIRDEMEENE